MLSSCLQIACGPVNTLMDKAAIEKDLDRLDKWIKEEVLDGKSRTWQKESMTAVHGRD